MSEQWLEVTLPVPAQELDWVCDVLTANGMAGLVVEEEGEFLRFLEQNRQYWDYVDEGLAARMKGASRVKFYVPDNQEGQRQLRQYLSGLERYEPQTISLREEDWATSWQKYYQPISVGKKIYIVPEWMRGQDVPDGRVPLYLNPGLTFGTGSHATTQLCLELLEQVSAPTVRPDLAKVTGGNLYIFHLSCKESLDILRKAQDEGVHVYAETCIHYLTMDMSQYDRPDGANFICSPPLRSKADVEAQWQGIQEGRIGVVSSDHCGFTLANKATGGNDFTATPNGLPGMETRLPALYTYGVKAGRISLSKMVELLSANPARAFGMYPRKGTLAPGSDGDLVIFDPSEEKVISPAVLHSPVDWNPFDGQTLSGFAQAVYLAGKPIIQDGACLAAPGAGKFVQRDAKAICIFDR